MSMLMTLRSWATSRRKLLADIVGCSVETVAAAVPGVNIAARFLGGLIEKATESVLDPDTGKPLTTEHLTQITTWLETLSNSYGGLLDRLERGNPPDGDMGEMTAWVKQALASSAEMASAFDESRRGRVSKALETDPFSFGKSLSSTQANFNGNYPYGGAEKGPYLKRTCKVGSYAANGLGIHDMYGNVREWCQDRDAADYYANSPDRDPGGPPSGFDRVFRGTGWNGQGWHCRSAFRNRDNPSSRNKGLGFRVLAVPSGQE